MVNKSVIDQIPLKQGLNEIVKSKNLSSDSPKPPYALFKWFGKDCAPVSSPGDINDDIEEYAWNQDDILEAEIEANVNSSSSTIEYTGVYMNNSNNSSYNESSIMESIIDSNSEYIKLNDEYNNLFKDQLTEFRNLDIDS